MKTSKYNYTAKNYGKDLIYYNRLMLIDKLNFDVKKTSERYSYYMTAYLGIVLQ